MYLAYAYIHTHTAHAAMRADLVLGAAASAPVVGLAGLNLDGHRRFFSADHLVAVLDLHGRNSGCGGKFFKEKWLQIQPHLNQRFKSESRRAKMEPGIGSGGLARHIDEDPARSRYVLADAAKGAEKGLDVLERLAEGVAKLATNSHKSSM